MPAVALTGPGRRVNLLTLNGIRPGRLIFPRPSREQALVFLGFLVLTAVLLRDVFFRGRVFFYRDVHMWWLPRVETFVRCLHEGSWPLWDPWSAFGLPMLADRAIYYPLTWLNLVLMPGTSYTVFVAFHGLVAATGVYVLARRWQVSAGGAFVAASIWLASPVFALANLVQHLAGAAWMPWIAAAADLVLARPTAGRAISCAGVMAVQIMAGSVDMAAMTWTVVALQVATYGRRRRPMATMAGAAVLALAFSAVHWWPTLLQASASDRFALGEADRTTWSIHPLVLLEVIVPFRWFELPLKPSYVAAVQENRDPLVASVYLGVPCVALIAAAFVPALRQRRVFLLTVAVGATLVALGRHAPFYAMLTTLAPPLRVLRFPAKVMVLAGMAWSILAGTGWDAWRTEPAGAPRWRTRVLAAVIGAAMVALLAGIVAAAGTPMAPMLMDGAGLPARARVRVVAGALVAAAVLAAVLVHARRPAPPGRLSVWVGAAALASIVGAHLWIEPTAAAAAFRYRPEVLQWIPRGARVYVEDYSMRTRLERDRGVVRPMPYVLARLPMGATRPEGLMLGAHAYLNPPTPARWGLRGSYDLDMLGLYDRWLSRMTEALREREGTADHLRLLQTAGVEYVLALRDSADWRPLLPVGTVAGFFHEPIRVFRVPDTLPLAYGVGRSEIVAEVEPALARLTAPSFDPRATVLLAEGLAMRAGEAFRGAVEVVLRKPDRLRVRTDFTAPGYLVLLEGYDPGWRARVDGRPADVRRANMVFRAVAVPAGSHVVDMVYRPRSVVVGGAVSCAALLAALLLIAGSRFARSVGEPPVFTPPAS